MGIDEIQTCIDNGIDGEGIIGNLRWIYYPHLSTIGFAHQPSFDRWANSRIIEVFPWTIGKDDPPLITIVKTLVELMG